MYVYVLLFESPKLPSEVGNPHVTMEEMGHP